MQQAADWFISSLFVLSPDKKKDQAGRQGTGGVSGEGENKERNC